MAKDHTFFIMVNSLPIYLIKYVTDKLFILAIFQPAMNMRIEVITSKLVGINNHPIWLNQNIFRLENVFFSQIKTLKFILRDFEIC